MRLIDRKIVLEDGSEYYGYGFGSYADRVCEIVFNTSMVGYQEIVSDPSYTDQMVVMTYPLIGNYGITDDDFECKNPSIGGLIVYDYNDMPSNFRYTKTLSELLEENGIPGISGVDTRKLTRSIRDLGSRRVLITSPDIPAEVAVEIIKNTPVAHDAVSRVSCKKRWYSRTSNPQFNVVAIDCGMKLNIVRSLNKFGCNVVVVPYDTPADEIEFMKPDGVFLSNGPGDPEDVTPVINTVKALRGKYPIFGICLGHQCIGEAFGGTVSYAKTLFHGKQSEVTHCLDGVFTGIDTPVKVARYHSLAVLRDDLPECLKVTAQTADGEIMAMRHKEYPVVGLQFHPESIYTEHGKRMIENFLSGVI